MKHIPLAATVVVIAACASAPAGDTTVRPSAGIPTQPETGAKGRGSVVYGPINQIRYRLDSHDSLAMEMPDGSFQRTVNVRSAFLTMSLRELGAVLSAQLSLDSIALDRPNAMMQPLVDSARGTQWQGTIGRSGRLDSLVANRNSVLGEQVRAMLNRLMPVLPDSGAESGDQWDDQATLPYQLMAGFTASEERRSAFRASKWEESRGARFLPIESTLDYTVRGSGSGFGQQIEVQGSGRATGTHRISTSGILLEAQVEDSVGLTLTVPAVGQSVPTVLISRYSLNTLP